MSKGTRHTSLGPDFVRKADGNILTYPAKAFHTLAKEPAQRDDRFPYEASAIQIRRGSFA
jgi:hypothetical protein